MNKRIKVYLLLLFAGVLCTPSCNKKGSLNIDYQYDYFPMDTAHYVDYIVDSIAYSYNGNYQRDSAHYEQREMIGDTFYDNLGKANLELLIYRRPDSLSNWSFVKKWLVSRDITRAFKIEDDLKYVKLTFPPKADATWNGNEFIPNGQQIPIPYNIFLDWNYGYDAVDQPLTINGQQFNSTLVVSEVNDSTLLDKRLRKEIYAKGIGMIYQEWEILSKQNVQADWNTGPESGFRIRMKVKAHYP